MEAILAIAELRLKFVWRVVSLATIAAVFAVLPLIAEAQTDTMAILTSARARAQAVYSEVRTSREIHSWDVAGPRDRTPNYCVDQCGCLAGKFVPALRAQGFETVKVMIRPARGSMGIRIRGVNQSSIYGMSYAYHVITMIKANGEWFVLDPIVIGSTHLEPLKVWETRLESSVVYSSR